MKEAIGGTSLFMIVVAFILLFTGIMSVTINHAKAFAVKDDIIQYIENKNGDIYNNSDESNLSDDFVSILSNDAYWATSMCDNSNDEQNNSSFVGYARNGTLLDSGQQASICLKKTQTDQSTYLDSTIGEGKYIKDDTSRGCYFEVQVFYKLDIPILRTIFNFNVKGQTKTLYGSSCK
jgi:hypothetical protein